MHIRLDIHDDQVAHVIFDRKDSSANLFDVDAMRELDAHINAISADTSIRGVVFQSAKERIFIAGADIKGFIGHNVTTDDLEHMAATGQQIFNKIAALAIPTVAAIHGACFGGGLEMCLACDYRIASDEKVTKIGLPETSLGIVPAWGGCTRLPRLVGLPRALVMILQAKRLAARPAKKYGVVDQIVPRGHFDRWARKLILQGKAQAKSHWKTNNFLAARFISSRARSQLREKTRGHYPAVFRALDITVRGLSLPTAKTLRLERMALVELMQGEISNNLVRIFFMQERAKHLRLKDVSIISGRVKDESSLSPVKNVAIVGAGIMGAGIAQWCSARGHSVILKDIGTEPLARGMSAIGTVYHGATKRHVFTRTEARMGMDRIRPTHLDVPLDATDMIIEAATENMEIKKKIFAGLEAATDGQTILATNTSALSITELAESTSCPGRVIGIHFFNPVHRMQLVEIVVGEQTDPVTIARTLQFIQDLGKLPVVTRDSPGFAVNRILMPYLTEAGHLFNAGAGTHDIDEAMLEFGMPMGPLRLLDEVGIDVAHHVAQFFGTAFGDRMPAPDSLEKMVDQGLLGRKSGKGFYLYDNRRKGEPQVNTALLSLRNSNNAASLSREQLQERMVMVMLNEAARCMEEEVVSAPEDIDFAMIMGTGFAPFRGGPLRYTDSLGAGHVVTCLERLAEQDYDRFAPSAVLLSMAGTDGSWYPGDRKNS